MPERAAGGVACGVGAVVMAAGAGRRMGYRPKSLLLRDGEPLLLRQIRLMRLAGAQHIVVVLGHHAERIAPVLEHAAAFNPRLRWVTNPAPDDGPASSLRHGLAALPASLDAVLVVLGDQPLLEPGDTEAVLAAWRARPQGIALVVPVHAGTPGHPIAFGAQLRDAVQTRGEAVRDWRRAHPTKVLHLPLAHDRASTDVDTPEALQQLARTHGVALSWPD